MLSHSHSLKPFSSPEPSESPGLSFRLSRVNGSEAFRIVTSNYTTTFGGFIEIKDKEEPHNADELLHFLAGGDSNDSDIGPILQGLNIDPTHLQVPRRYNSNANASASANTRNTSVSHRVNNARIGTQSATIMSRIPWMCPPISSFLPFLSCVKDLTQGGNSTTGNATPATSTTSKREPVCGPEFKWEEVAHGHQKMIIYVLFDSAWYDHLADRNCGSHYHQSTPFSASEFTTASKLPEQRQHRGTIMVMTTDSVTQPSNLEPPPRAAPLCPRGAGARVRVQEVMHYQNHHDLW